MSKCVVCGDPQLPKWFFCKSCKRLWERDKVVDMPPFDAADWAGRIAQRKLLGRVKRAEKRRDEWIEYTQEKVKEIQDLSKALVRAHNRLEELEKGKK